MGNDICKALGIVPGTYVLVVIKYIFFSDLLRIGYLREQNIERMNHL